MGEATLWTLDDHTRGKHLVLKKYLNAWFPIITKYNDKVLFVDGFAGPGEYAGGEDGSPIIAIDTLINHQHFSKIHCQIVFIFIENDEKRIQHLEDTINSRYPNLPKNITIKCYNSAFDKSLTEALNHIDEHNKQLVPSFLMIDPFGVSDTPMEVIKRVMKNPKCEIYISVMYEYVNRFISTAEFAPHLDDLLGTDEWRPLRDIKQEERKNAFYSLYRNQLKKNNCKHVVNFELYNGNILKYVIFYATNHSKGCDKMKNAIWGIAPDGNYAFKPKDEGQYYLDDMSMYQESIEKELVDEFGTQEVIDIDDITKFMESDSTIYHTGQLKNMTLKPMEKASPPRIEVLSSPRKGKNGYPSGTKIRFV